MGPSCFGGKGTLLGGALEGNRFVATYFGTTAGLMSGSETESENCFFATRSSSKASAEEE